jgi:predicted transglutaminase-like cysteine proteinase
MRTALNKNRETSLMHYQAQVIRPCSLMVGAFLFMALATGPASAAEGFAPWSEDVYRDIRDRFGEAAERRAHRIWQFVSDYHSAAELEKAKQTNLLANHLPWIADRQKYSTSDYWATPLETVMTYGGDCEDIAITKFVILRMLGVPAEKMRLAHVVLRSSGKHHMVLTYQPDPVGEAIYVLDNMTPLMLTGAERRDLKLVFTVDATRQADVYRDKGSTRQLVKSVNNAKLAKLTEIQRKMAENREYFIQLNGGKPLF